MSKQVTIYTGKGITNFANVKFVSVEKTFVVVTQEDNTVNKFRLNTVERVEEKNNGNN